MSNIREEIKAEAQLAELRSANVSLLRKLDKEKRRNVEIINAVTLAVRDAIASIEIPIVPAPKPDKRTRTAETAIAVVSDWQLGKRTPTYSTAICEERVERYAEKMLELTAIQRTDHPVEELRVYLLGDLVEGELIFSGQSHRIDASLFRQVLVDGPRILSTFLRRMLGKFKKVDVIGVAGNHGALGGPSRKEYHPESNADMMLYEATRLLMLAEPRLTWTENFIPNERRWFAIDTIGVHRFLLFHGDQTRGGGFGGLPYYGFARAINNWAAGVIPGGFSYALCGHWHQAGSIPVNDRVLWINGSTESGNEWLREELKAQCPPSQWLLFAHPKNGVTCEYRVWL